MRLRVATWNVRYSSSISKIAASILTGNCDVWLLQELPDLERLLSALGEDWSGQYALSQAGTRTHGIAIVSRIPTSQVSSRQISCYRTPAGNQRRHYLEATIGSMVYACVHLSCTSPFSVLSGRNRRDIKKLLTLIEHRDERFILGGDFNAGRRSPGLRKLKQRLSIVIPRRLHTWSHGFLGRHLDHFFTTPDVHVYSFERLPRGPSDHQPLVIEIET